MKIESYKPNMGISRRVPLLYETTYFASADEARTSDEGGVVLRIAFTAFAISRGTQTIMTADVLCGPGPNPRFWNKKCPSPSVHMGELQYIPPRPVYTTMCGHFLPPGMGGLCCPALSGAKHGNYAARYRPRRAKFEYMHKIPTKHIH